MENPEIIDVEVVDEKIFDKPIKEKPTKVKSSDRSRQVERYTKLYLLCMRFGFSTFLLFLFGGLAFSILFSQATNKPLFMGLMITFWVFTGLALTFWLLGFFFKKLANINMAKDPNYHGGQL